MSFRVRGFVAVMALLVISTAMAGDMDGNSMDMLKAAEAASAKGDMGAAASLSNLAVLRMRADMYCFPPADREGLEGDFARRQAALDDRLRAPTLGDPAILARMATDAEAWTPTLTKSYDPGWKSATRCDDYAGVVNRLKAQMLPLMQRGATLLAVPEYRRAYLVYMDVMQDYSAPPPEGAYGPKRVADLAEAIGTMRRIESENSLPYFGQMAGMDTMQPVPFHVIASGQAARPVAYNDGADPAVANGVTHIIGDAAGLARLWHALYGDGASAPAMPAVDFSKQVVILALAQGRSITASRMFISRIESEDKPFPGLMVFLRIPVWPGTCFPHAATVYPYAVALMDRPGQLPPSAGFDMQNFPATGCPEIIGGRPQ